MERTTRRFWLWAGAALMAGLVLRLWFAAHLARVEGDSLVYGGIAKNLLQSGVYGFGHEMTAGGLTVVRPTLIRLPGYPLFLAVCFRVFGMEHYHAVLYVQVAADLLSCWLGSALAGRLFGNRAALAVLWLGALCPFTANYVAAPLTETLTLLTIALAFYGFARWQDAGAGLNRWLWVIGAALAGSVVLRPEQVLFAGAVLAALLWRALVEREAGQPRLMSALPALTAAMCTVLPLVPWTARNWSAFHVFQPLVPRYANDPGDLAPEGFGRWYKSWAVDFASTDEVYWNYDGESIQLADLPSRAFDLGSSSASADLRNRTAALLASYNVTKNPTAAIDAGFAALAAERIRAHPVLYCVGLPVARLGNMILRPRLEMMPIPDEWWKSPTPPRQTVFAASYAAMNLGYLALGLAGFWAWKRSGWWAAGSRGGRELAFAMAASLILRSLLLLTIDNSEPRYTLEFFPVLFVWAGALFATPEEAEGAEQSAGSGSER